MTTSSKTEETLPNQPSSSPSPSSPPYDHVEKPSQSPSSPPSNHDVEKPSPSSPPYDHVEKASQSPSSPPYDHVEKPSQSPSSPPSNHDVEKPSPPSPPYDHVEKPSQLPSSPPSNDDVEKPSPSSPPSGHDDEKWGTHIMGPPSAPSSHPSNQKAALWRAEDDPYLQYAPVEKSRTNPIEPVIHVFNSWTNKADTLARNIWQNLKTGSSVSGAAWGKMGLTAKAITGGGFESLYKQIFTTDPNEKLKRRFACYMSTSTGPVAGTLYLSNIHVAFCSDRPLSFTAPSGQETWGYYKVMIPLGKLSAITPVSMKENQSERYIQLSTIDEHEFWFMGFVNYEKACGHLSDSKIEFQTRQIATEPPVVG